MNNEAKENNENDKNDHENPFKNLISLENNFETKNLIHDKKMKSSTNNLTFSDFKKVNQQELSNFRDSQKMISDNMNYIPFNPYMIPTSYPFPFNSQHALIAQENEKNFKSQVQLNQLNQMKYSNFQPMIYGQSLYPPNFPNFPLNSQDFSKNQNKETNLKKMVEYFNQTPTEKNNKNKNQTHNSSEQKNNLENSLKKKINTNIQFFIKNSEVSNLENELRDELNSELIKIQEEFPEIKSYNLILQNNKNLEDSLKNTSNLESPSLNSDKNVKTLKKTEEKIEKMLFNIFENTILKNLQNIRNKNFKNQIIFQILKIYSSDLFSLQKNFSSNFFKWFNLGLPIPHDLFQEISISNKTKLLTYLFSKYINLSQVQYLYNINLHQKVDEHKNLDLDEFIMPDLHNYLKIQSLEETKSNQIFLKKILSLLIHQLNIFKIYLDLKSNENKNDQNKISDFLNEQKNTLIDYINFQEDIKKNFLYDQNLKKESFESLVNKIDIRDLQIYIIISNISFSCGLKKKSKIVHYVKDDIKYSFNLSKFERDFLLGGKPKRKDEKNKFVFRSVRKKILFKFKWSLKKKINLKKIKRLFNDKYLNSDEDAIKYFYGNELSSRNLNIIADCKRLIKKMKECLYTHYLPDQIKNCLQRKSEEIFDEYNLLDSKFIVLLEDLKTRHSWNLQDLIDAIPSFEHFFVFSNKTKRIKK